MDWLNEITKGHAPEAIIIIALVLILRVLISIFMAGMAKQKGYGDLLFFFICFIFGIYGYILTALLPDRKLRAACDELYELLSKSNDGSTTDGIIPESDDARKPSGRTAYVPSESDNSAKSQSSAVEKIKKYWGEAEKRKKRD